MCQRSKPVPPPVLHGKARIRTDRGGCESATGSRRGWEAAHPPQCPQSRLRRRPAACRACQRTGTGSCSHTHTCPGPPGSSRAPRAPRHRRRHAGPAGRRAGRWSPAPQRTRAAPWGSRHGCAAWPSAEGRTPRPAAAPARTRSRGGTAHCRSAALWEEGQ